MTESRLRSEPSVVGSAVSTVEESVEAFGAKMLIAYEPIGEGIGFLLGCCVGGAGLLLWVVFWLFHKFRAPVPVTPTGRIALWCVVGLLVVAAGLFPPVRQAGNWRDVSSGQPVPSESADKLDRFYFGWIPKFVWVGNVGSEEALSPGVLVRLEAKDISGRCDRVRWFVDWLAAAVEIGSFALLVAPFVRAKRPSPTARTLAAERLS